MKRDKWIFCFTNIVLVLLVFIFFLLYLFRDLPLLQTECTFYRILGYYCPGCGGTRAFKAFMHGRWFQSLWYHPFVPYSILLMLCYSASNWIEKLSKGKIRIGIRFHDWYLYAGLVLIVVNFIVKNILLYNGIAMD